MSGVIESINPSSLIKNLTNIATIAAGDNLMSMASSHSNTMNFYILVFMLTVGAMGFLVIAKLNKAEKEHRL